MQQKRKIPRSAPPPITKPARLELRPDRAFVLHLDVRAQLPRRVVGRIEHVTSGQVAHVTSLGKLMAFMAKVLRNQARGERGTAYAAEGGRHELELMTLSLGLDSPKRAPRRQVIGNQLAADWPLRVTAEGSARANPTTRAQGAKDQKPKRRFL